MKKLVTLCSALLISVFGFTQGLDWAQYSLGGIFRPFDIALDADSNIIVVGRIAQEVTIDPLGTPQVIDVPTLSYGIVLKLNSDGEYLWHYIVECDSDVQINEVATDSQGDIYFPGVIYGSVTFTGGGPTFENNGIITSSFLAKISASGEFQWAHHVDVAFESSIWTVDIDTNDDLFIGGSLFGTYDFDFGPGENLVGASSQNTTFAGKYTSTGEVVWVHGVQGSGFLAGAKLDNDDNIMISGVINANASTDFDPSVEVYELESYDASDTFFWKLTNDGEFVWAGLVGNDVNNSVRRVGMDSDGGIIYVILVDAPMDVDPTAGVTMFDPGAEPTGLLAKVNNDGSFAWGVDIGTSNVNDFTGMFPADQGGFYLTGLADDAFDIDPSDDGTTIVSGNDDTFYAHFNADGEFQEVNIFGSTGDELIFDLISLPNDRFIVSGQAKQGNCDLDPSSEEFIVNFSDSQSLFVIDYTTPCAIESDMESTVCESFTLPDGTILTEAGEYTYTVENELGCDSLITLDLSIQVIALEVMADASALTAAQLDATYQWVDCANNFAPIEGETEVEFVFTEDGSYAVEISYEGCTAMSECVDVIFDGIGEQAANAILLYPNPTNGSLTIEGEGTGTLQLMDITGKTILTQMLTGPKETIEIDLPAGVYSYSISTASSRVQTGRLVVE